MGVNASVTTSQDLLPSLLLVIAILTPAYYFLYGSHTDDARAQNGTGIDDGHAHLDDHCTLASYATAKATYPSVRTYYRPHAHRAKLEAIADLPLLVLIHGLGGVLPQFAPLLHSLVNVAPCFGIELPGHGQSAFAPTDYDAYKLQALAALWKVAIKRACTKHGHTRVVLIGHSMGCSITALLATDANFKPVVAGVVAICPKASPPTASQRRMFQRFLSLPDWVLDTIRWFDRRGGEESASVRRFVGEGADSSLKRQQLKYNEVFTTPVWKRMVMGIIATSGEPSDDFPGQATWSKVQTPLLLIAGESDSVTPPGDVHEIVSCLQHASNRATNAMHPPDNATEVRPAPTVPSSTGSTIKADDRAFGTAPNIVVKKTRHDTVLKTAILPAPASHALLYSHATYRTVAGLIEDFLSSQISPHLSLGWQLQQLTTSGKWDVKNLEKWQKVMPVSGSIHHNFFRALKTLREQDQIHTPKNFVSSWKDTIYAVIDISHDAPVYSTRVLEDAGIQYHKFPTVSKIPPTTTEVADFISLVDRLRSEMEAKGQQGKAIGVHCHYGYNRTGFFISAYLVEKKGYQVDDAIAEFEKAKPPGIRHSHFVDTLHVRYTVGLRRLSTVADHESVGR